jgi:hypothetical protein
MAAGMKAAFTDLKHDIHYVVAEGSIVAVGITLRISTREAGRRSGAAAGARGQRAAPLRVDALSQSSVVL